MALTPVQKALLNLFKGIHLEPSAEVVEQTRRAAEAAGLLREIDQLNEQAEAFGQEHPTSAEQRAAIERRSGDPVLAAVLDKMYPAEPAPTVITPTPPPPDPGPSLTVPPGYQKPEVLGQGGMGVAYKAQESNPRREVVVKIIRENCLADHDALCRFRGEANAIVKLKHPNIITIHAVGEHGGRPYYTMEYCPEGSLADALRPGGRLSPKATARVVRTLAKAVQHAHGRGVIHRDLKPANILLVRDEREVRSFTEAPDSFTLKIADFGLAKALAEGGGPNLTGVLGTPNYMAPEQAVEGACKDDPRIDAWALGAILYELLTGRPPFVGENKEEIMRKLGQDKVEPPRRHNRKVPLDLNAVCMRCLAKDIDARYTVADLLEDLNNYLAIRPVNARPLTPVGNAGKWLRRNARVVIPIGLALLAITAGGGMMWQTKSAADAKAEKAEAERATEKARADNLTLQQQKTKLALDHAEERRKNDSLLLLVANTAKAARDNQLYEEAVRTARATVIKGDRLAAIPLFDVAISRASADRPHEVYSLRLQRLHCQSLHLDPATLLKEIEALRRDAPPPDTKQARHDAASLDLLEGEVLMGSGQAEQGRSFFARALASRNLDPQDGSYAAAMFGRHSTQAVEYLESAVTTDPNHARSHYALLTLRLLRGEQTEVRRHAQQVRTLAPNDPLPDVVDALALITLEDYEKALAIFDRARPALEPARFARIRAYLETFADAHGRLAKHDRGEAPLKPEEIAPLFLKVAGAAGPDTVPFSFSLAASAWWPDRLTRLARAELIGQQVLSGRMTEVQLRAADRQLEELCDDAPEPDMLVHSAVTKLFLASQAKRRKDEAAMWRLSRESSDRFNAAGRAPSLFPASTTRYLARVAALHGDDALLRIGKEDPALVPDTAERWRRMQDNLSVVLSQRPRYRHAWEQLVAPAALKSNSDSFVRALIEGWHASAPRDPVPLRTYVEVLLALGLPEEAFSHADKALRLFPKDSVLTDLREKAREASLKRLKAPPAKKDPTKGP